MMTTRCDHTIIDTGPCECLKKDRCYLCCDRHDKMKAWVSWDIGDQSPNMYVQAENASKARYQAYQEMGAAGYSLVKYTDVRVRRVRVP